jgi:hypothetical protein
MVSKRRADGNDLTAEILPGCSAMPRIGAPKAAQVLARRGGDTAELYPYFRGLLFACRLL